MYFLSSRIQSVWWHRNFCSPLYIFLAFLPFFQMCIPSIQILSLFQHVALVFQIRYAISLYYFLDTPTSHFIFRSKLSLAYISNQSIFIFIFYPSGTLVKIVKWSCIIWFVQFQNFITSHYPKCACFTPSLNLIFVEVPHLRPDVLLQFLVFPCEKSCILYVCVIFLHRYA